MMLLRVLPFASEQMATTLNRRTELNERWQNKSKSKTEKSVVALRR